MVKDISADKRNAYNLEISSHESEIENVREEEKKLFQEMEELNKTMTTNFSQLEALNQELIQQGGRNAQVAMEENQAMSRSIKKILEEQKVEMSQAYREFSREKEEKIEDLQKKRDCLPWKAETNKKES